MTQDMMMDLNTPITPDDSPEMSFEPVPKGKYECQLTEVKDWEAKTYPEMMVTKYDPQTNKAMKAADGKTTIKEKVFNATVYSTTAVLKIVSGEFAGRLLFHRLTTHPSTPFINARFVNGLGAGPVPAAQFAKYVGAMMEVSVEVKTFPEEDILSKKTGEMIEAHSMKKNECTFFKPIEMPF